MNDETDGFQIGDILDHQWGYDQTNHDFHRVIARFAIKIEVRRG